MRITLTYKGEIPGNKRPPEKIDEIRQDFHRQLEKIWGRDQLEILKNWVDSDFAAGARDFRRVLGHHTYLPIVSDTIKARVRLDISLYRGLHPHQSVYVRGDIDNRVKSLIDAMAPPSQVSAIPASAPKRDTICLMFDDSLVDELTVRTAPLLAEDDPRQSFAVIEAVIVPGDQLLVSTLPIVV